MCDCVYVCVCVCVNSKCVYALCLGYPTLRYPLT